MSADDLSLAEIYVITAISWYFQLAPASCPADLASPAALTFINLAGHITVQYTDKEVNLRKIGAGGENQRHTRQCSPGIFAVEAMRAVLDADHPAALLIPFDGPTEPRHGGP
jgi:hypothetical protein